MGTSSQPSREIYAVDVPEVRSFSARFRYNFFVADESINESGGTPIEALTRPTDQIDANFIQRSISRVPRFVEFSFTPSKLSDVAAEPDLQRRNDIFRGSAEQDGTLIRRNLDKIVNEDFFSTNNYVTIQFHDGEIDDKVHQLVSSSISQQMLQEESSTNVSHYIKARRFIPQLPNGVKSSFILDALTLPKQGYGASFYSQAGSSGGAKTQRSSTSDRSESVVVTNELYTQLKQVVTNAQVNSKFLQGLLDKAIADPAAPGAADMSSMQGYAAQMKQAMNQRFTNKVNERDYKSIVPFIDVQIRKSAAHVQKYSAEVVGYIIDKIELSSDGTVKNHPPIIIDNAFTNTTADFQVKFSARYCYTARTIVLLTIPAIDDETGDIATLKVLVSSKPSNKEYVTTVDDVAPPPPGDVDFIWDYQTNKLLVTWAFPVTSQRDIKRFQVFSRDSVENPFELQKEYDFNDSIVKFSTGENPDPRVVESITSPATFWIDDSFDRDVNSSLEKSKIYAVCALDAHGMTSAYSAQFRIWFDRFKNQLQKKLVSHSGAPKPYPNMYIEGDVFQDTIRASGPHARSMKLYFNPEYYYVYDDQGRQTRVVQTKQTGGAYRLQFINVDNVKSQAIDIEIDDRTQVKQPAASPNVYLGPKVNLQK